MKFAFLAIAVAWLSVGFKAHAETGYQPFPITTPSRLHFVAENVFGGSIHIDLAQGVITIHRTGSDESSSDRTVQPSGEEWRKFIRSLNKSRIYMWAPTYADRNVVDGGGWEIKLNVGEDYFNSSGVNAFPKDGALYMPAEYKNSRMSFDQFWKALCKLTRENPAHFPLN